MPFTFGVLGFLRLVNATGFVNFQLRCQQVMMLWALAGVLSVGLMPFLAPMQFIIFVPALAFFAVNFFNSFKKGWLAELTFMVSLGIMAYLYYQGAYGGDESFAKLNSLKLKRKEDLQIKNKKVLVLGNGMEEYLDNYAATPYLNWNLAKYELEHLDNYDNVISILRNFEKDTPEVIIDKVNLVPKLFKRIPALARRYTEQSKGVYVRIS